MMTFIAAAVILVLGVAAMCVFLLKKDGEFPKYDVGSNPEMRKMGIRCFKDVDADLHRAPGKECEKEIGDSCSDCSLKCK